MLFGFHKVFVFEEYPFSPWIRDACIYYTSDKKLICKYQPQEACCSVITIRKINLWGWFSLRVFRWKVLKYLLYLRNFYCIECVGISTYFSMFPCLFRKLGYNCIYTLGIRSFQFQGISGLAVMHERLNGQVPSVMRKALVCVGALCVFLSSCDYRKNLFELARQKNDDKPLELIHVRAKCHSREWRFIK